MSTELLNCAIVASYKFKFWEDDPNRKNKTEALKNCTYRGKGKQELGFCQATCSHPKASEDLFLSKFCPRATLFFDK